MKTFTERIAKIPYYYYIVLLSVLVAVIAIWAFTGLWPWHDNPYNSYAIQANAWLDGHLDIGDDRPWLELAIYNEKYFVSFPPFPSYVLLPFAAVFGEDTPDGWIALIVLLVGALYATKIYEKIAADKSSILFYTLFLYLASGLMFVGVNGYVWFFAQNMCFTLSLMSIYYALIGRGGLSLSFWACAVGCRPMTVLYLPLLVILIWKEYFDKIGKNNKNLSEKIADIVRNKWNICICPIIIAISYMILNYKRFGSVLEFGHNYLPEFTHTSTGQFNISYLIPNIKKLLYLPPINEETSAISFPTAEGFAFYIATPLLIVVFVAWIYRLIRVIKEKNNQNNKYTLLILILLPVLAIAEVIIICLHKTLGGWSFGNRYLLDIYPWIYYGFLLWKPTSEKFDRCMVPFMIWGLLINMTGTVATYNHWI